MAAAKRCVPSARRSTPRPTTCTAVVSNLLDMGRLQAGMLGVHLQPTVVEEVVYARARQPVGRRVDGRRSTCPTTFRRSLADPALLERAVANVILNALELGPRGTRSCVSRPVSPVAGSTFVSIDRGAGIPPRPDATRCSSRSNGSATAAGLPYDGIGLGLAVTKGFVDAMDGEVVIDDTPGGGHDRGDHPEGGNVSRVLVVDDDPAHPEDTRGQPARPRLRGRPGPHGRGGAPDRRSPPSRMPSSWTSGCPAWTASTSCAACVAGRSVPIVVLSGRGTEAAKVEALDLGADDYLTKPFGMDELFARLRAAMRRAVLPEGRAVLDDPRLHHRLRRQAGPTAATRWSGSRPTQWHIVEVLVRHAGKLVTYEQVLHEVWGPTLRQGDELPPRLHDPDPPEARARTVAPDLLPHRAGHRLPLRDAGGDGAPRRQAADGSAASARPSVCASATATFRLPALVTRPTIGTASM